MVQPLRLYRESYSFSSIYFINDLIILLSRRCQLYNYADNNTLSYSHYDPNVVK